jgi:hypothetical protein
MNEKWKEGKRGGTCCVSGVFSRKVTKENQKWQELRR